jgi:tetratricopeptide (TPR) repeat protein
MRLLLVLAILLAGVTPGAAAPLDEARKLVGEANRDYKLARFDAALGNYEKAYELAPSPRLLFNIAQCHRHLGHHERAIFFFEGYLREVPRGKNRKLVETLLAEERTAFAAEQAELARRRAAETPSSPPIDTRVKVDPGPPPPVLVAAPAPKKRPITKQWWFWTAVGIGAAAATTTVVLLATGGDAELPSGTAGTLDRR